MTMQHSVQIHQLTEVPRAESSGYISVQVQSLETTSVTVLVCCCMYNRFDWCNGQEAFRVATVIVVDNLSSYRYKLASSHPMKASAIMSYRDTVWA